MAYAVRHIKSQQMEGGPSEDRVVASTIVYADSVADALAKGERTLGIDAELLTVDYIDDGMSDELAAGAAELYPGQTEDSGMIANVTDKMRGASQTKVYGSGEPA